MVFGIFFHENTPEEDFWEWFSKNSEKIYDFVKNQEEIFDRIEEKLRVIHPDLVFEISAEKNGKREFVISADGLKSAFPYVINLVKAAKSFNKWKIVAFRQRGRLGNIEFKGISLNLEDLFFHSVPYGEDKLGLEIYIRNPKEVTHTVKHAVFLLLDCAIGEYAVATRVGFVEIMPFPENATGFDIRPFTLLAKTVDDYFEKKSHE